LSTLWHNLALTLGYLSFMLISITLTLVALRWPRVGAGILVGAITVIVWKHFELLGLYEIVPGFSFASLAIYIVSKLGAPTAGMLSRFAAAEADFRLNK